MPGAEVLDTREHPPGGPGEHGQVTPQASRVPGPLLALRRRALGEAKPRAMRKWPPDRAPEGQDGQPDQHEARPVSPSADTHPDGCRCPPPVGAGT